MSAVIDRGDGTPTVSDSVLRPLPAVRRRRVAEMIERNGAVTCSTVQLLFRVSAATARRDLDHLAREGVALRVHGGAMSP
jgi:DeoR/GlpR family transcriptional regulator of sugar metabolism